MRWRPARVCRAEIDRRTVLFSAQSQTLVALNDAAARLWRQLELGVPAETATGLEADGSAAARVLGAWADAGLIQEVHGTSDDPEAGRAVGNGTTMAPRRATIEIGSVAIGLDLCSALADDVWPYLAHLPLCQRKPQVTLRLRESRQGAVDDPARAFGLWRGRWLVRRCAAEEVVPALKLQITSEVLEHGCHVLALHAAALVVNGKTLIITGPPGAGKSTLTVALIAAGFGFAADDLVLLDADGVARGAPLWPGLKEGSWTMLESQLQAGVACPAHRRPDGRAVRYVPPGPHLAAGRRGVGWIIVLTDGAEQPRALAPIHPLDTLPALISGASARGDRLSEEGFGALASLVGGAECFSLARLPVADAVGAIEAAVGCPCGRPPR